MSRIKEQGLVNDTDIANDELIIECREDVSLDAICEQMGRTPPWAEGLVLRADWYCTRFYKNE